MLNKIGNWKLFGVPLILLATVCSASASSLQLARCVNYNAKAASVMRSAGNMEQFNNFSKFVEEFTAAGRRLYGESTFNGDLAATRPAAVSATNDELVKVLPGCLELANSMNAQLARSVNREVEQVTIPFTVVNRSSQPIDQVFVSPSTSNDWGRDLLGDDSIEPGQDLVVRLSQSKTCIQDIRVVFRDKSIYESGKKDFCKTVSFTLNDSSRTRQNTTQSQPQGGERTYCAVSTMGGPPVGCGLTLSQCQHAVRGISGMMCR